MSQSEKPDFRLVYDGEGGLRMAPANTVDREPEPHIVWNPDGEARLETHIDRPPRLPAPDRRPLMVAGLVLLGVVGAGAGLLLRLPRPAAEASPVAAGAGRMQVQVKPDAPPPRLAMVRTPDRLEVLSPETRRKAEGAAPAARPAAPMARPAPELEPPAVESDDPPIATRADQLRQARRGTDCGWARSRAEAMVCDDPGLAAADRRMARAYRGAVRSGAPLAKLRAEQDDWLDLREDAAGISRRAVAQLYAQRIDELEALADPQ